MTQLPTPEGRNYSPQLAEAVQAWRVAQETPNGETSADLGVKVHRFARSLSLDTAAAMKIVRQAGQAEIDAEADAQPDPRAETPGREPVAVPTYLITLSWTATSRTGASLSGLIELSQFGPKIDGRPVELAPAHLPYVKALVADDLSGQGLSNIQTTITNVWRWEN